MKWYSEKRMVSGPGNALGPLAILIGASRLGPLGRLQTSKRPCNLDPLGEIDDGQNDQDDDQYPNQTIAGGYSHWNLLAKLTKKC